MYVYVLSSPGHDYVKIGRSIDVEKRLSQLQTASPHSLVLRGKVPTGNFASRVERLVHERLNGAHHKGEWFSIGADVALQEVHRALESCRREHSTPTPPRRLEGQGARTATSMTEDLSGMPLHDAFRLLRRRSVYGAEILHIRYVLESFLRRLQTSCHAGNLVLKGDMLMLAIPDSLDPTSAVSLHSTVQRDDEGIVSLLREVADATPQEEDSVRFDFSASKVIAMRKDLIPGLRVEFDAHIGRSPVRMKFDVCFGDVIVPDPVIRELPSVLGGPSVTILGYAWETAVAEKLHAIAEFGMDATRLKDFYDIAVISRREEIDGEDAVAAIRECFAQRGTRLETDPVGLSPAFVDYRAKDFKRWRKKKGPLSHHFDSLEDLVAELRHFLIPLCEAAAVEGPCPGTWYPGEGWLEPVQVPEP